MGTPISVEPFHVIRYVGVEYFRNVEDGDRFRVAFGQVESKRVMCQSLVGENHAEPVATSASAAENGFGLVN